MKIQIKKAMNYEKIYQDFYLKYYSKAEILIKNFLIKRHSEKRIFNYSINEVMFYLDKNFRNRFISYNNEILYQTFLESRRFYSIDVIQEVFNNEVKAEFDKINILELPANYNYSKLIKEIALIEVENDIRRLLSKNYNLLDMFYKLNKFDEFEIKEYKGLYLEDTQIFIKLHSELYPESYDHSKEKNTTDVFLGKSTNERAIELFDYLIENYRENETTSVKYVNILHYLKNDTNKELYIFKISQKDYKEKIKLIANIEIKKFAKSEQYFEVERLILDSFERRFAKEIS